MSAIGDDWDDDWEHSVFEQTNDQIQTRINQLKVEESDTKLAQNLFQDEDVDLTIMEYKKEKESREKQQCDSKAQKKVKRHKREISEKEIIQRKNKKKQQQLDQDAKKQQKSFNERCLAIYGHSTDSDEYYHYGDIEDNCLNHNH